MTLRNTAPTAAMESQQHVDYTSDKKSQHKVAEPQNKEVVR